MKTVLLTAASGVLGSVISQYFIEAGWHVTGFSRRMHGVVELRRRGVDAQLGGVADTKALACLAGQADCIVHSALYHDFEKPEVLAVDRRTQEMFREMSQTTGCRVLVAQDIRVFASATQRELMPDQPSPPPYRLGAEADNHVAPNLWHLIRVPPLLFGRGSKRGLSPYVELARSSGVSCYLEGNTARFGWATLDTTAALFLQAANGRCARPILHASDGPPIAQRTIAECIADLMRVPCRGMTERDAHAIGASAAHLLDAGLSFAESTAPNEAISTRAQLTHDLRRLLRAL